MHNFGLFNKLLSTQNVNLAHNVKWDFFCDFQTLCLHLPFVNRNISPMVFVAKSLSGWPLSPPTWPLFWSWRLAGRDIVVLLTMRPSILHCENHQIGPLKPPQSLLYQIRYVTCGFCMITSAMSTLSWVLKSGAIFSKTGTFVFKASRAFSTWLIKFSSSCFPCKFRRPGVLGLRKMEIFFWISNILDSSCTRCPNKFWTGI